MAVAGAGSEDNSAGVWRRSFNKYLAAKLIESTVLGLSMPKEEGERGQDEEAEELQELEDHSGSD